jgi:hypothetical protein
MAHSLTCDPSQLKPNELRVATTGYADSLHQSAVHSMVVAERCSIGSVTHQHHAACRTPATGVTPPRATRPRSCSLGTLPSIKTSGTTKQGTSATPRKRCSRPRGGPPLAFRVALWRPLPRGLPQNHNSPPAAVGCCLVFHSAEKERPAAIATTRHPALTDRARRTPASCARHP